MGLNTLLEVGQFIGVIALLIIIHEIGHFLASKLFGIEVEEFGIGFPPRITTLFEAGGTKFSLNWIPLGGFVRPKGENNPKIEGGLASANPWKRLVVFAAGPAMNLILAGVLYTTIYTQTGAPVFDQVQVVGVSEDSPAMEAGLRPGDIITQINETKINNSHKLRREINSHLGETITVVYEHNGETNTVNMIPRNPPPPDGAIGIAYANPSQNTSFFGALPAGFQTVIEYARELLTIPARIIEGSIAPEQARLVGFKGMYDLYQDVTQEEESIGIPPAIRGMAFFASISISLGLLNLLPIPALDGGRIVFVLPEIILQRRIPPDYENLINLVSFTMLLLLMIYINVQDFVNPPDFR